MDINNAWYKVLQKSAFQMFVWKEMHSIHLINLSDTHNTFKYSGAPVKKYVSFGQLLDLL